MDDRYVNLDDLRLKVAGMSDDQQRTFMRELTMQTHVAFNRHMEEEIDTKTKVDRIHMALFAPDANNEFGRTGAMNTFIRIDNFLDVSCTVAKWIRGAIYTFLAVGTGIAGIGKYLGWW